jgi:long-chain acyl-CoA synthetase
MSSSNIETIASLFIDRVARTGPEAAIHVKRDGAYQGTTWNELADDVYRAAAVFRSLGIAPGDRVAHWSENRYEWIVTDVAIQMCRAIHVPMHAPLSAPQAIYQVRHSGAKLAVVSGAEQIEKFHAVESDFPDDVNILSHDEVDAQLCGQAVRQWRPLAGDDAVEIGSELARQAADDVTADSLATILYTSGTTGEPKGVMLSHRNIVSNVLGVLEQFGDEEGDLRLCFLPLSHIFARVADLYTWIGGGSQLALAESRETILADCLAIRPTIINGVPYFYERVQRGLVEAGAAETPGALLQLLGGNIRICCSGGAALPNHIFDFFERQEVPIRQGYGLTESSPVITLSSLENFRRGTVGLPLSDVEVRIAEDGEILARGPNIMLGYWNDEAATHAAIKDDWLYTGDLGELDKDGYLQITGRKKELIVTATGKNIAPTLIESLLCRDPLIDQAMVLGDDQSCLAALIVPSQDHLQAEVEKRQIQAADHAALLTDSAVCELFAECIQRQLSELSHHEQVRRFVLLDRGFTIDDGQLTPKASLRREVIARDFAKQIAELYQ